MAIVGQILSYLIMLYLGVMLARMVLSFVPVFVPDFRPKGLVLVIAEVVYTLTDPPLKALRKIIPPVRIGNAMLDVAFMVLWLLLLVLQQVVGRIFFG